MGNKSQRVIQLEHQLEQLELEREAYQNQIRALILEIGSWQTHCHELEAELATWKHPTAYHMTSPIHGSIDTSGLERHEG